MNQRQFDEMLTDPKAWDAYRGWRGNPIAKLFDNFGPSYHRSALEEHLTYSDEDKAYVNMRRRPLRKKN